MSVCSITDFPEEVIDLMMDFVKPADLCSTALVCWAWNGITNIESRWKKVCELRGVYKKRSDQSWRECAKMSVLFQRDWIKGHIMHKTPTVHSTKIEIPRDSHFSTFENLVAIIPPVNSHIFLPQTIQIYDLLSQEFSELYKDVTMPSQILNCVFNRQYLAFYSTQAGIPILDIHYPDNDSKKATLPTTLQSYRVASSENWLAFSGRDGVIIYNPYTAQIVKKIPANGSYFEIKEDRLVVVDTKTFELSIWDLNSFQEIYRQVTPDPCNYAFNGSKCVDFAPLRRSSMVVHDVDQPKAKIVEKTCKNGYYTLKGDILAMRNNTDSSLYLTNINTGEEKKFSREAPPLPSRRPENDPMSGSSRIVWLGNTLFFLNDMNCVETWSFS